MKEFEIVTKEKCTMDFRRSSSGVSYHVTTLIMKSFWDASAAGSKTDQNCEGHEWRKGTCFFPLVIAEKLEGDKEVC